MDTENGFWFWTSVCTAVLAFFAWAASSGAGIGNAWIPWLATIVFVLAFGGLMVRTWRKAKSIVWTDELREAQRHRVTHQLNDLLLWITGGLCLLVSFNLVSSNTLPLWVGSILFFVMSVGWFWYWWVVPRSKA